MRKPRKLLNGAYYHVTAKINRGEHIFEEDLIKEIFRQVLIEARQKFKFSLRNYCIMSNHVHLLLRPSDSLSKIMQWILAVFAKRYNRLLKQKGHVWYDRFHSVLVKFKEQLATVFKYISNNPLKAGLVKHANDWDYSGYTDIKRFKLDVITLRGFFRHLIGADQFISP